MFRGVWPLAPKAERSQRSSANDISCLSDLESAIRQTQWLAVSYQNLLNPLVDTSLRDYRKSIEELESLEALRDQRIKALPDLNRPGKPLKTTENKNSAGSVNMETSISQFNEFRAMQVIFHRVTVPQYMFDKVEETVKNLTENFERLRKITEDLEISSETNTYSQRKPPLKGTLIQRRILNLMRRMGLEVKYMKYWDQGVKDGLGWLVQSKEIFGSEVYQKKVNIIKEIQTLRSGLRLRLESHIHDRPPPDKFFCSNCTQTSLMDHIDGMRQSVLVLENGRKRHIEMRAVWEGYVQEHMTWLD